MAANFALAHHSASRHIYRDEWRIVAGGRNLVSATEVARTDVKRWNKISKNDGAADNAGGQGTKLKMAAAMKQED